VVACETGLVTPANRHSGRFPAAIYGSNSGRHHVGAGNCAPHATWAYWMRQYPGRFVPRHLRYHHAYGLRRARPPGSAARVGPAPPISSACQRSRVRGDTIRRRRRRCPPGAAGPARTRARGPPSTASGSWAGAGARRPGGAGEGSRRPWHDRSGRAGQVSRARGAPPDGPVVVTRVLTVPEHAVPAQPDPLTRRSSAKA
jgi:hypothetical protein